MTFHLILKSLKVATLALPLALVACAGRGYSAQNCGYNMSCGASVHGHFGDGNHGAMAQGCGQPVHIGANGCAYGVNWVAVPTYKQVYVEYFPTAPQPIPYIEAVKTPAPYVAPTPTPHSPYVPPIVAEPYVAPQTYPTVPYRPPTYLPARK